MSAAAAAGGRLASAGRRSRLTSSPARPWRSERRQRSSSGQRRSGSSCRLPSTRRRTPVFSSGFWFGLRGVERADAARERDSSRRRRRGRRLAREERRSLSAFLRPVAWHTSARRPHHCCVALRARARASERAQADGGASSNSESPPTKQLTPLPSFWRTSYLRRTCLSISSSAIAPPSRPLGACRGSRETEREGAFERSRERVEELSRCSSLALSRSQARALCRRRCD